MKAIAKFTLPTFFSQIKAPKRWRTLLALGLMIGSTLTGYYSLLGIMFLWWILPAIHFGEFHFVEVITIRDDPKMFWLVASFWIITSFAMILWDIYMVIRYFYF